MPVSIWVVHETSLEHLVIGGFDSWDHVSWGEGSLLRLGVEVLWVLVQDELANLLEWVVRMRPDFCDVVDIEAVVLSISDRHDLSVPGPSWEVALLDVVEEVHGGVILGALAHFSGLLSGKVLDALVGLVMILDKELLVLGVNPLKGVRAVSIHVPEAIRGSTVGHQNGHLVESLGRVTPEIPGHVRVLHTGLRVPFLAVDEVRELDWVLDEKDRCVVTDHIIVALFRVVLEGETTRVTIAIVGTPLASHCREAQEDGCTLANGVHEGCFAEPNNTKKERTQGSYRWLTVMQNGKVYLDGTYRVISSVISR